MRARALRTLTLAGLLTVETACSGVGCGPRHSFFVHFPAWPSHRNGTKVEPKSGVVFVRVPGGTRAGATRRTFWLTRDPVTVAAYEKCVVAGTCEAPITTYGYASINICGREDEPIRCLQPAQGSQFCRWIGGGLPTQEEELAAVRARVTPAFELVRDDRYSVRCALPCNG